MKFGAYCQFIGPKWDVATVWVPVTAQFLLHQYRCHLVSPRFPRIVFCNVLICSSVCRVILEWDSRSSYSCLLCDLERPSFPFPRCSFRKRFLPIFIVLLSMLWMGLLVLRSGAMTWFASPSLSVPIQTQYADHKHTVICRWSRVLHCWQKVAECMLIWISSLDWYVIKHVPSIERRDNFYAESTPRSRELCLRYQVPY